jgi:hypothetical protein
MYAIGNRKHKENQWNKKIILLEDE